MTYGKKKIYLKFQPKEPRDRWEGIWLGAKDFGKDGRFIWDSTKYDLTYNNWFDGGIKGGIKENCAAMIREKEGVWDYVNCEFGVKQDTFCEVIFNCSITQITTTTATSTSTTSSSTTTPTTTTTIDTSTTTTTLTTTPTTTTTVTTTPTTTTTTTSTATTTTTMNNANLCKNG